METWRSGGRDMFISFDGSETVNTGSVFTADYRMINVSGMPAVNTLLKHESVTFFII